MKRPYFLGKVQFQFQFQFECEIRQTCTEINIPCENKHKIKNRTRHLRSYKYEHISYPKNRCQEPKELANQN